MKIGGFVRAEYEFLSNSRAFDPGVPGPTAAGTAKANGILLTGRQRAESGFFLRGRLDADARTQTGYGTLRTYARYHIDETAGAEAYNSGFAANPAGDSQTA